MRSLFRLLEIDVGNRHPCAGSSKYLADAQPYTAGPSGHDDKPSSQTVDHLQ
jgi:hypothetical protein